MSLALKAKVTREKTSDDSDSQGGSDEDVDEEEAEEFNLMARNFHVIDLKKENEELLSDSQGGSDEDIEEEEEADAFNMMARNFRKFFRKEGHFASECRKPKENKEFVGGAWSDSEDDDEPQNDATCLMAIDSQEVVSKPSNSNYDLNNIDLQKENEELLRFNKNFNKSFEKLLKEKRSLKNKNSKLLSKINDIEIEVKKLINDKEVVEPCKECEVLTKEVDFLKCTVSKLQDEALNFSKFKRVALF
ncbi:hypothetical protein Tco_1401220 [Tanacetum coccineum]